MFHGSQSRNPAQYQEYGAVYQQATYKRKLIVAAWYIHVPVFLQDERTTFDNKMVITPILSQIVQYQNFADICFNKVQWFLYGFPCVHDMHLPYNR